MATTTNRCMKYEEHTRNEETMYTPKSQPQQRNLCDGCCKDMGERSTRYCEECMKKIAERSQPRNCRFCGGENTVHATYLMEGDYGGPYICHTCMKDQADGYVWEKIPNHIVDAFIERGEDAL
jgi:hypothetical protein